MNKLYFLLVSILLMFSSNIFSQTSLALDKDGEHIVYSLSDIQKVYFDGDIMVVKFINNTEFRSDVALLSSTSYNNEDPTALNNVIDKVNSFSFTIFPNPVDDELNVSYNVENSAKIDINIYNLNGQFECNLLNNSTESGIVTRRFLVNHMPSGNYIIQISSDQFSMSQILIKK